MLGLFPAECHKIIAQVSPITDSNVRIDLDIPSGDTQFIDPLTVNSLYVETVKFIRGSFQTTGSATAFVYTEDSTNYYLITNWHVVNSRSPTDSSANVAEVFNQSGNKEKIDVSDPEILRVYFHSTIALGEWYPQELILRDRGDRKWLNHPLGKIVDVVAIKLDSDIVENKFINLYPIYLPDFEDDILIYPTMNVTILGFPFGFASQGYFPIYKTGQIASDYSININNLPLFYIDAATRPGMSGSPVVGIQIGSGMSASGGFRVGGRAQKLLGVYSGRLPNDSDVGLVWKPTAIADIIHK